jgi:hypothetical protein
MTRQIPSKASSASCSRPCQKCLDRVELELEQARLELNRVIDLRHDPKRVTQEEFDTAVGLMQVARDRMTQVQRGHCFCREEVTQP